MQRVDGDGDGEGREDWKNMWLISLVPRPPLKP